MSFKLTEEQAERIMDAQDYDVALKQPGHFSGPAAGEDVVISSYAAYFQPECRERLLADYAAIDGVEVQGEQDGAYIVTVEAPTVAATYEIATRLANLKGVLSLGFVYCNFEDMDPSQPQASEGGGHD
jgi:nitrate reductase NapAB chaperone NapD